MKDQILYQASEMFLEIGFKSVTMDDIAKKLSVSKKTIYKFYKNKTDLIRESVYYFHSTWLDHVKKIELQFYNPIKENFEINKIFSQLFKNAVSSPIYQLKNYYPDIYEKILTEESGVFSECISSNLKRGIQQDYYRRDLNIELYTDFYFSLIQSIHEKADATTDILDLEKNALIYHTRAIATEKGIIELKKQLIT